MDKIDQSAQEKILEAARKVFIAKGMAGARMQDIANEAGINKALLHYYFRSKEKLFEVIFQEVSTSFFPLINEIFEAEIPLFEKIERFCSVYIEKIVENPFIPIFILNEMNQQPDIFIEKIFGGKLPNVPAMIIQIKNEVAEGKIKPIKPEHLFMNMMSMCIFPFVAKPIWMKISGTGDQEFVALMNERKQEIPKFIIESIKK